MEEIVRKKGKWKQEIKETRKAAMHKGNARAELSRLRQKVEPDNHLKRDEAKRLETHLQTLQMFHQFSNVSLEGDTFLYNGIKVASLDPPEHSEHWNCMKCSVNEVSVVFLLCTHQVLCASCYEGSCSTSESRQQCP